MDTRKDDDKITCTLTRGELRVLLAGMTQLIIHEGRCGKYTLEKLEEFADHIYRLYASPKNQRDNFYLRLNIEQVIDMLEDLNTREDSLGCMGTGLSDNDKSIREQLRALWLERKGVPWEES